MLHRLVLLLALALPATGLTVSVVTPNGGEVWAAGSTQSISWTYGGGTVDRDSIWYSIDRGSSWIFVAEKHPATTTHLWFIPNTLSAEALVRVKVINSAGSAFDQSDAVFAISGRASGWYPLPPVPGEGAVKEGGSLACNPDNGRVYEMKGNKSLEFHGYGIAETTWAGLSPIPSGLKAPKSGASMATGAGKVFITKGNNTLEFCRYDITTGAWLPATATVPLGDGWKVRAGGSMAFVRKSEGDFVYLLKGYGTDFYKYDLAGDSFITLTSAPTGMRGRYDKGSWIAYDGAQFIYCNKAKYSEFYKYDVLAEQWSPQRLAPLPLSGPMSPRMKMTGSGSCAAWGNNALYALKGSGTHSFWKYIPDESTGTWIEVDTLPRVAFPGDKPKNAKAGASLTYYPAGNVFFAQKGNKCNQFWMYVPGTGRTVGNWPMRDGVAEAGRLSDPCRLSIAPNPLVRGRVTVRWSSSEATFQSRVRVSVYDAAGRAIVAGKTLPRSAGSATLDLRGTPAGVYIVRLTADGLAASRKLVVER